MIRIKNLNSEHPKEKYDFRIIKGWSELYNKYAKDKKPETAKQVKKFKTYFNNKLKTKDEFILAELYILIKAYKKYGKLNLYCYCDNECHGNVIKEYIVNLLRKEETKNGRKSNSDYSRSYYNTRSTSKKRKRSSKGK